MTGPPEVTGGREQYRSETTPGDCLPLVAGDDFVSRSTVRSYVRQLDADRRAFLLEQSRNVLAAHGDIQEEHRNQANRLLRAYVGGIGLLLAGFGLSNAVVRRLTLPAVGEQAITNPTVIGILFVLAVTVSGGFFVLRAFLRFAGTIEIVAQILTPERISSDSRVSVVFSNLPFYPGEAAIEGGNEAFPEMAREGIRRVTQAEDLLGVAKQPASAETRILTDRLLRAQQNEVVINYNMRQLSRVYGIINQSLVDALFGSFLLLIGLMTLTAL